MSTFVNNDVASGNVIFASDHNEMGSRVAAVLNGGLDNANINASAAIATSKLADDAGVTTAKLGAASVNDTKVDWTTSGHIWWQELGRQTLGTSGDTVTITTIPAKKYLKIIWTGIPSGAIRGCLRFNNDSGTNYASRLSVNGASDSLDTSSTSIKVEQVTATIRRTEYDIINIATTEKMVNFVSSDTATAGATTAPGRIEGSGKWANTSAQITRVDVVNDQAGDFAVGSELVVLGHD